MLRAYMLVGSRSATPTTSQLVLHTGQVVAWVWIIFYKHWNIIKMLLIWRYNCEYMWNTLMHCKQSVWWQIRNLGLCNPLSNCSIQMQQWVKSSLSSSKALLMLLTLAILYRLFFFKVKNWNKIVNQVSKRLMIHLFSVNFHLIFSKTENSWTNMPIFFDSICFASHTN